MGSEAIGQSHNPQACRPVPQLRLKRRRSAERFPEPAGNRGTTVAVLPVFCLRPQFAERSAPAREISGPEGRAASPFCRGGEARGRRDHDQVIDFTVLYAAASHRFGTIPPHIGPVTGRTATFCRSAVGPIPPDSPPILAGRRPVREGDGSIIRHNGDTRRCQSLDTRPPAQRIFRHNGDVHIRIFRHNSDTRHRRAGHPEDQAVDSYRRIAPLRLEVTPKRRFPKIMDRGATRRTHFKTGRKSPSCHRRAPLPVAGRRHGFVQP